MGGLNITIHSNWLPTLASLGNLGCMAVMTYALSTLGSVYDVAYRPDGEVLAVAAGNTVQVSRK